MGGFPHPQNGDFAGLQIVAWVEVAGPRDHHTYRARTARTAMHP